MAERLLLAFAAALLLTVLLGPLLLPVLRILKFGQYIRTDGPKAHQKKAGTPTMGGILFLIGIVVSTLLAAEKPLSVETTVLLGSMLAFGVIGFIDDYIKVVLKRNLGLRAYQKLLGQFAVAFLLLWIGGYYLGGGTALLMPFTATRLSLGIAYYPLLAVILVFFVNAVNLTDGLDGLAAGSSAITAVGYVILAVLWSRYAAPGLLSAHVSDFAVFAAALAGGCIGFLRFNAHPARVFMGDTGSLALGGAFAGMAVLSKSEWVVLLMGGLFLVEAGSVVIQVLCFQTTGKRVFRMSPLHHHFELGGWKERKVVRVFWLAAAVFTLLGILACLPGLR
ncbi:MAG: phospho-N-acetylmuramoyl-pentapeptide-transferase [Peptococcaceae bacterium]|nr:phospho-N-acetylmuramoyl-pentapeptide-transferase [Peptococcaceae bacterium]